MKARVHRGRWISDCYCSSASRLYRFQPGFICPECGRGVEVEWPSEEMAYGIERLILMRPFVANQNWEPHETLQDLMVENALHGIFAGLTEGHLTIAPERILVDTLPSNRLPEFKAIA